MRIAHYLMQPIVYRWLGAAAFIAISIAPQDDGTALMGASAHAQQVAASKKAPDLKYNVETMLKGPRFEMVDIAKYDQRIKSGNVMTFLYENSVDSASTRLATVMMGLSEKFPEMQFIALERKNSVRGELYLERGYEASPDFMLFSGGKLIYRNPSVLNGKKGGGPSAGYEAGWITALERNIKKAMESSIVRTPN